MKVIGFILRWIGRLGLVFLGLGIALYITGNVDAVLNYGDVVNMVGMAITSGILIYMGKRIAKAAGQKKIVTTDGSDEGFEFERFDSENDECANKKSI